MYNIKCHKCGGTQGVIVQGTQNKLVCVDCNTYIKFLSKKQDNSRMIHVYSGGVSKASSESVVTSSKPTTSDVQLPCNCNIVCHKCGGTVGLITQQNTRYKLTCDSCKAYIKWVSKEDLRRLDTKVFQTGAAPDVKQTKAIVQSNVEVATDNEQVSEVIENASITSTYTDEMFEQDVMHYNETYEQSYADTEPLYAENEIAQTIEDDVIVIHRDTQNNVTLLEINDKQYKVPDDKVITLYVGGINKQYLYNKD